MGMNIREYVELSTIGQQIRLEQLKVEEQLDAMELRSSMGKIAKLQSKLQLAQQMLEDSDAKSDQLIAAKQALTAKALELLKED